MTPPPPRPGAGERFITPQDEQTLLKLSRHVLVRFVEDKVQRFPDGDFPDLAITDDLRRPAGVFVTLKAAMQLRGCIGTIVAQMPLYQAVIENTMNSAARDLRFPPMRVEELPSTRIEISVMSPLVKVASLNEVVVGRDGLMIRAAGRSGVFLPQVPVEWRWNKQQYLEELGVKAGLGRDGYKRKDAEFWRFTAQVFKEK
jgi:AmmeMemoRadiSam system protein A